MTHSLLTLSQAYANGKIEQTAYRLKRHGLIQQILDFEEDNTRPGGLVKQTCDKMNVPPDPQTSTTMNPHSPVVSFKSVNRRFRYNTLGLLLAIFCILALIVVKRLWMQEEIVEQMTQSPLSISFAQITKDGVIDAVEDEQFFELWQQSTTQQQQQWKTGILQQQALYAKSIDTKRMSINAQIKRVLKETENLLNDNEDEMIFDAQIPAETH